MLGLKAKLIAAAFGLSAVLGGAAYTFYLKAEVANKETELAVANAAIAEAVETNKVNEDTILLMQSQMNLYATLAAEREYMRQVDQYRFQEMVELYEELKQEVDDPTRACLDLKHDPKLNRLLPGPEGDNESSLPTPEGSYIPNERDTGTSI